MDGCLNGMAMSSVGGEYQRAGCSNADLRGLWSFVRTSYMYIPKRYPNTKTGEINLVSANNPLLLILRYIALYKLYISRHTHSESRIQDLSTVNNT